MKEAKKIYVKDDCTIILTCPHCNKGKPVSVEKFKGKKTSLKIKCSCAKTFSVNLEFRKKIRKNTRLQGNFTNQSQNKAHGRLLVINLSLDGLEFTTMDYQGISLNDELTVQFYLDDENRTEIEREVTVKRIIDSKIGCQFSHNAKYCMDKSLGFYLMS